MGDLLFQQMWIHFLLFRRLLPWFRLQNKLFCFKPFICFFNGYEILVYLVDWSFTQPLHLIPHKWLPLYLLNNRCLNLSNRICIDCTIIPYCTLSWYHGGGWRYVILGVSTALIGLLGIIMVVSYAVIEANVGCLHYLRLRYILLQTLIICHLLLPLLLHIQTMLPKSWLFRRPMLSDNLVSNTILCLLYCLFNLWWLWLNWWLLWVLW